jgi:hypothetical protein
MSEQNIPEAGAAQTSGVTAPKPDAIRPVFLAVSLVFALGLVFLVLRGGWSLGFFLAVLLTEVVFVVWQLLPLAREPRQTRPAGLRVALPVQVALVAVIVDLALCIVLYDDMAIKVLDFLMIFALLPLQYLVLSRISLQDWDRPAFWLETVVAFFIRPFSGLSGFGRCVMGLFQRSDANGSAGSAARRTIGTGGKILLGLLLAVPVLLLSGSLLAAADPVFARFTSQLWSRLSINELAIQLFLALIILPFIFSFLYSGKVRQRFIDHDGTSFARIGTENNGLRFDKIILITFLTCINLLYILFAIIQVAYLTGAFQAILPDNMTYAEYARSGFFELAGVTFINLILVLLAVKAADRRGATGAVLRAESLLLIAGSLVQWASAMFRMKMYIDAYGLSLLRFWVTAFMLLQLVVFMLLLVKEFRKAFPLFKCCTTAVLVSLVLLNHVNSDAWIARYNVDRYMVTGQIDTEFFNELSSSAVPAMLELTASDDPKNAAVAREIAWQLVYRRLDGLDRHAEWRWQQFNFAQDHAKKLVEDQLDRLNVLASDRKP